MEIKFFTPQTNVANGGQASHGLFGLPGCSGKSNCKEVTRLSAVPLATPVRRGDDQPRRIGGLTFGQRRARIQASVDAAYIAWRKEQAARAVAAPTAPAAPARTERNEIGEMVPVAIATIAMRATASFSEARLRRECETRFQAALVLRQAGAGFTERLMALDG